MNILSYFKNLFKSSEKQPQCINETIISEPTLVVPKSIISKQSFVPEDVYTLIGIREFKNIQHCKEHGNLEMTNYIVFLSKILTISVYNKNNVQDDKHIREYYYFRAENKCGNCFSNWIAGSWGIFTSLKKIPKIPKKTILTYKPIDINLSVVVIRMKDDNCLLQTLNKENIIYCSHVGDDPCYPNGSVWLRKDLLEKVEVVRPIKKIYVFDENVLPLKWMINFNINPNWKLYESNASKYVPLDIAKYDLIVISKDYPHHSKLIFSILENNLSIKISRFTYGFEE
jgi:hypothetical protein